jgi:hypothetical protein
MVTEFPAILAAASANPCDHKDDWAANVHE